MIHRSTFFFFSYEKQYLNDIIYILNIILNFVVFITILQPLSPHGLPEVYIDLGNLQVILSWTIYLIYDSRQFLFYSSRLGISSSSYCPVVAENIKGKRVTS